MSHILIVEDDKAVNDLIAMTMDIAGYRCSRAFDGEEALTQLQNENFDLVMLDVMLPKMDGFELFARMNRSVPVIFLTARTGIPDRVRGLRMGAQDYIVKPFDTMELLARVENVLRRSKPQSERFQIFDVALDASTRIVTLRNEPIELTPQEFGLLALLMRNPNIALTREQMLDAAWGYDYYGGTRTVDMHVQKLRKKLGWEERIKTVYKLGYRLEVL